MRYLLVFLLTLPVGAQAQTFDQIEAALDSLAQIEIHGPDSLGMAWIEYDYRNGIHAEIFFIQGRDAYAWIIVTGDSARVMTETHGTLDMAPSDLLAAQHLGRLPYSPGSIGALIQTIQAIGAAKARTRPIIE